MLVGKAINYATRLSKKLGSKQVYESDPLRRKVSREFHDAGEKVDQENCISKKEVRSPMRDLQEAVIIFGYSGHASVVMDALMNSGRRILGYLDRQRSQNDPFQLTYLGHEDDGEARRHLEANSYFVGIGDNTIRQRIMEWCDEQGYRAAESAIHGRAYIARGVEVKAGSLFCVNTVVNPGTTIGRGCILNTASIVEHDCVVEDYCHIAPGAMLLGQVRIQSGAFIGSGAVILPGLTVGKNSVIGAGAVVTTDVNDGATVVGVPAKQVSRPS